MYNPVKDGIEKTAKFVQYTEVKPPDDIADLVHCFWELKTVATLKENFHLHAIPDACIDVMFNEIDIEIAGVTGLDIKYEVLNLGKEFHYVGIQFLPGVWQGNRDEVSDRYIGEKYTGRLPLVKTNENMVGLNFSDKQIIMADLVRQLADEKTISANPVTAKILSHLDDTRTVADMANAAGVSPRQLQRILKQSTGFSPHDFLKVVRLQKAFSQDYDMLYADQSHFIHSFRSITGYTPSQYFSKFDV
ncbi:MAG: Transcriptional regulator, AraC family [Candidatus Saccharibacteria bacterium GW2011_GWC2_48_9]|nr:MAG: Transcriptional regulator, AraC family [Candidatus Saccharibacteria bacterium GW2011_GWC2_48_9]HCH34358.1 AraC family transcriptional regulator [Candidatus Saccharibacteria bacterium]